MDYDVRFGFTWAIVQMIIVLLCRYYSSIYNIVMCVTEGTGKAVQSIEGELHAELHKLTQVCLNLPHLGQFTTHV